MSKKENQEMIVDLHGYGYFKVDTNRYEEFKNTLQLETDFLLDLMNFPAVPILSINAEKIEKEGPIPYAHHPSEIGKKRLRSLLDKGIVTRHQAE